MSSDFAFALTPGPFEAYGNPFWALATVVPVALLVSIWILIARSGFIQGDDVERPSRVAQLYGYTVCLIAVVMFITSTISLLENSLTLANPLQSREAEFGVEPSVSSFEAYRATYDRERQFGPPGASVNRDTVPEPVLRQRYAALRDDRIARTRFQAQRSLATSVLSLVLALALFAIHWRWLRSREHELPAVAVRQ